MRAHTTRTRWAAVGAAVAVTLGGGGLSLTHAAIGSGEKPVYVALSEPCRLVDTRPQNAIGPKSTPIAAGEPAAYEIQVTGANGNCVGPLAIPAAATAVALNVTAIAPSARSFFTVYPSDAALPTTSNLNFVAGQAPTPNKVDVGLSASGAISIYNDAGTSHAAVDVFGYYTDHHHDDRYYTEGEVDTLLATVSGAPGPQGPAGPQGLPGPDAFERIVVVQAAGTPTENGDDLLATAAGLTGTAAAPWAIQLEPGTYDLGSATLGLGAFTSLRGSGTGNTTVQSASPASVIDANDGSTIAALTVIGASITTSTNSGVVRIDAVDDVFVDDVVMTSSGRGLLVEQTSGTHIRALDITAAVYAVNLDDTVLGLIVTDSRVTATADAALDLGFATSNTLIDRTTITTTASNTGAVRTAGGDGVIRHSTLISATGGMFEIDNGAAEVYVTQSDVDVEDAFAGPGTFTCTALSTVGSFSGTGCI